MKLLQSITRQIRRPVVQRAATFMVGNVAGQGLSAIVGLLLARWLSIADYGLYTIATLLMGAISLLTKGGVHLGYSAIMGRVWPDMHRVGEATAAAMATRRRLSALVLPLIVVGTIVIYMMNGASWSIIGGMTLLLLVFWWADIQTRLVDQILFFSRRTSRVQILDSGLALFRLACTALLFAAGTLNVLTAVTISIVVSLLRVWPIWRWVRGVLAVRNLPPPIPEDMAEIRKSLRRQFPVEVYYVFQAQIVLFVISWLGGVTDIAGFGALSRINQLLLPVEAFTYAFCVPIFCRPPRTSWSLLTTLVALTMAPGLALILIAWLFPTPLLWLVGPNYANLHTELVISAGVAMMTRGVGTAWNLIAHRGLVRFSWLQIPVGLAACALAPLVLDLGTLRGVLLLQLAFVFGLAVATAAEIISTKRGSPQ